MKCSAYALVCLIMMLGAYTDALAWGGKFKKPRWAQHAQEAAKKTGDDVKAGVQNGVSSTAAAASSAAGQVADTTQHATVVIAGQARDVIVRAGESIDDARERAEKGLEAIDGTAWRSYKSVVKSLEEVKGLKSVAVNALDVAKKQRDSLPDVHADTYVAQKVQEVRTTASEITPQVSAPKVEISTTAFSDFNAQSIASLRRIADDISHRAKESGGDLADGVQAFGRRASEVIRESGVQINQAIIEFGRRRQQDWDTLSHDLSDPAGIAGSGGGTCNGDGSTGIRIQCAHERKSAASDTAKILAGKRNALSEPTKNALRTMTTDLKSALSQITLD